MLSAGWPAGASALVDPGNAVLPNLDVRADEKPTASEQRAIASLDASLGDQGFADTAGGGIAFLGSTDGYLTGASQASPEQVSRAYVADHRAAFGLDSSDLSQLELSDSYTSADGVTHLTFSQMSHGIASYDTFVRTNVDAKGRLINVSGSPAGDVSIAGATPRSAPATRSPSRAMTSAATRSFPTSRTAATIPTARPPSPDRMSRRA